MNRIVFALLLAVLAFPVLGADDTPMSSSPKPPKPKAAATPPPEKVSPAQQKVRDLDIAKVKFMSAVGACPRPEDCDPESPRKNPDLVDMLKKGEDFFMEACVQCATDKACEQERDRIRAGKGRMGYNVCQPPGTKPKGMDSGKKPAPATADKKAAPATPPAK